MAKIAIMAGAIAAGIGISILTGGLGTFAVGAWAADIVAGATVGAAVGQSVEGLMFPGSESRWFEDEGEDDDENRTT